MCWFSTEHAANIEEARAGQRLAIKKMPWHSNWVVRETELEASHPCPVCLIDRTRVLFRFEESHQPSSSHGSEAEAVFRMLKLVHASTYSSSQTETNLHWPICLPV